MGRGATLIGLNPIATRGRLVSDPSVDDENKGNNPGENEDAEEEEEKGCDARFLIGFGVPAFARLVDKRGVDPGILGSLPPCFLRQVQVMPVSLRRMHTSCSRGTDILGGPLLPRSMNSAWFGGTLESEPQLDLFERLPQLVQPSDLAVEVNDLVVVAALGRRRVGSGKLRVEVGLLTSSVSSRLIDLGPRSAEPCELLGRLVAGGASLRRGRPRHAPTDESALQRRVCVRKLLRKGLGLRGRRQRRKSRLSMIDRVLQLFHLANGLRLLFVSLRDVVSGLRDNARLRVHFIDTCGHVLRLELAVAPVEFRDFYLQAQRHCCHRRLRLLRILLRDHEG
mmetsp:Transcript_87484/g.245634  ORF Transcript_87484/g.245634 Transcript_87484/m.245634 type:complete len:338 (+) Transcript_87484:21-1034(+)